MALLRGVNVGGRGTVPMAALRELCESLGLADVATYLQSGNVVFRTPLPVTGDELAAAIGRRFGLATSVVLRSADELAQVAAGNPFPGADPLTVHVGFMAAAPDQAAVDGLDTRRYLPEAVVVTGRELYFRLPSGMGRASLPPYVGRRLGVPTTVRNWRTVTALARLAAD